MLGDMADSDPPPSSFKLPNVGGIDNNEDALKGLDPAPDDQHHWFPTGKRPDTYECRRCKEHRTAAPGEQIPVEGCPGGPNEGPPPVPGEWPV